DRLLGRGVPLYRTVRTDAATPLSPERCAVYSLRNPDYCEWSFVADRWCISRSAAAEFADCFRRLLGIAIVSTGPAPRNGLGSQREPPSKPFRDEKVSQWSTFPLFRRPRAPGRYLARGRRGRTRNVPGPAETGGTGDVAQPCPCVDQTEAPTGRPLSAPASSATDASSLTSTPAASVGGRISSISSTGRNRSTTSTSTSETAPQIRKVTRCSPTASPPK